MAAPSIASLLQQAATPNGANDVLTALRSHPQLAGQGDENGYTLLHASISYEALDLARALVREFNVNPNIPDSDGDTPLYFAETGAAAKVMVEELGADPDVKNSSDESPLDNAETNADDTDGEWGEVVKYLRGLKGADATTTTQTNGDVHPPPPLPPNVRVNVGTMSEQEMGNEEDVDPEFRQRIEELAQRDDFNAPSGQQELRKLVEDAVSGVSSAEAVAASRRRVN